MYDEKCLMCIGGNIRFLRAACQISQQEMAERIGVSQTHLSNLEHNHVQISLKLLLRIANLLGCSLETLLDARKASDWVSNRCESDETQQEFYSPEEVQQLLKLLRLSKQ